MAFVHPEAVLGDNNIIGPFCYIDRNVVIGDNNVFQNSVTLNYGTRLGSNNEIFPGASIATKPQDLKFRGEDTTARDWRQQLNSRKCDHQPWHGFQRKDRRRQQ